MINIENKDKISKLLSKHEDIANDYKGKYSQMKSWNDEPPLR